MPRSSVATLGTGVVMRVWVMSLGVFVWGWLATVVARLPEWDPILASPIVPLLAAAAFAGALPPARQATARRRLSSRKPISKTPPPAPPLRVRDRPARVGPSDGSGTGIATFATTQ